MLETLEKIGQVTIAEVGAEDDVIYVDASGITRRKSAFLLLSPSPSSMKLSLLGLPE